MKLFSIITVVLNDKTGFKRTAESLFMQSCNDYEYIVVDGNSTDGTLECIKQFGSKINTLISEKDNGIYEAMNKGIKSASGRYSFFLNASDIFYDNNVLETIKKIIADDNPDLVIGDVRKEIGITDIYSHETIRIPFSRKLLKRGIMPHHQGVFLKTKHYEDAGGFSTKYKSSGDVDLFQRLSSKNYDVLYAGCTISQFRGEGISSNKLISYRETYDSIKNNFGLYWSLKYYISRILIEQGIKKIFRFIGILNIYYMIKFGIEKYFRKKSEFIRKK